MKQASLRTGVYVVPAVVSVGLDDFRQAVTLTCMDELGWLTGLKPNDKNAFKAVVCAFLSDSRRVNTSDFEIFRRLCHMHNVSVDDSVSVAF